MNTRVFAQEDVEALIGVWDSCYGRYGGWVPRTVEHWRWNILARPDVEPPGIIVLSVDDQLSGYAVTTTSGTVLEFAVSQELPPRVRRRCATSILLALEDYARRKGLGTLELDLPATDTPVRRALSERGYHAEASESLQLVIVDLLALLECLLRRCAPHATTRETTFLLALDLGSYRFCPHRFVRISLETEPRAVAAVAETSADCVIKLEMSTLTEVILQRTDVRRALDTGRIVVAPRTSTEPSIRLLQSLVLRDPWYVPRADAR